MVAYNMDFSNVAPSSGGGKNFPISPPEGWLCAIVGEDTRAMKQGQGNRLVFLLKGIDQGVAGQSAEYGLNLQHPNPETMSIAQKELAGIAWATGTFRPGQTYMAGTETLWNKPFRVIVIQDADPRYTTIVGVRSQDGQDPVKLFNGTANGPTHTGGAGPQIGGGQPQGGQQGGMGGQPAGGGFGGGQPAGNPQGMGQGQPQGNQGGAPQGQQGGGFGGAPQGNPQGGGWGGAPQGGGQPDNGQGANFGGQPQGNGQPQGQGQPGGAQWGGGGTGGAPQWGG